MKDKKEAVISRKDLDGLFPIMCDMLMDAQREALEEGEEEYLRSFLEEVVRPAFNENFLYREIPADVYKNGHKLLLDDPGFKKFIAEQKGE